MTSKSASQDALDAKARVGFSLPKAFLIHQEQQNALPKLQSSDSWRGSVSG